MYQLSILKIDVTAVFCSKIFDVFRCENGGAYIYCIPIETGLLDSSFYFQQKSKPQ